MEFALKVEKFEGFLESIKSENPVLVESIMNGFKTIVESEESCDVKVGMTMKPKWGVWRTEHYPIGGQFDRLPDDSDISIVDVLAIGKNSKYGTCCEVKLSNGWKCAISRNSVNIPHDEEDESLTESVLDDVDFGNIKYEIGSVTDKDENGDGGQFVKVFSKNDDKVYLIMTDSKRNGPWKVMLGTNNGKILTTKPTLEDALRYLDKMSGEFATVNADCESCYKFDTLEELVSYYRDRMEQLAEINADFDTSYKEIVDGVKLSMEKSGFGDIPVNKIIELIYEV